MKSPEQIEATIAAIVDSFRTGTTEARFTAEQEAVKAWDAPQPGQGGAEEIGP